MRFESSAFRQIFIVHIQLPYGLCRVKIVHSTYKFFKYRVKMSVYVSVKCAEILNILKTRTFKDRYKVFDQIFDYIIKIEKLISCDPIKQAIKRQLYSKSLGSIVQMIGCCSKNNKTYSFIVFRVF